MYGSFARFFIKNAKLTFVIVLALLIGGVGSYIILPKQYNPTITAPAFQVSMTSFGLSSEENYQFLTQELENKILEIPGVDEVLGVSQDNGVGVMVKFVVGQDPESSKIKLQQKLSDHMSLKPLGVGDVQVTSINPDDLSQITYAISYVGEDLQSIQEQQIYLRQIANIIKNDLKLIPNTTTYDIVGGLKNNLVISLDLDKLQALGIDITQVYQALKTNHINPPLGDFRLESGEKIFLDIASQSHTKDSLGEIIITQKGDIGVYLKEVASFSYGSPLLTQYGRYSDTHFQDRESVFLGVGKALGSNGVFVTQKIKDAMIDLESRLPNDIHIALIQDEGHEAQLATDHLITDLIQSIAIVVLILVIFLGWRNALNSATSIPIVLSLVFIFALVAGFDINRISLFALILVIGMLVDDSIVVVENIHRHLTQDKGSGKPAVESIIEATQEVGMGVLLSTITKLLAFSAMFAVSGMMGEYMQPIPRYAIIALGFSLIIAFSINPWVSAMVEKYIPHKESKKTKKPRFDIRDWYIALMKGFINPSKNASKKRKALKFTFWIALILIITIPIQIGVFKMRMLPKSDKDQIYLWIDAPRGTTASYMADIELDIQDFFLDNSTLPDHLNITESVSSTIGQAFMGDFANLFRGGGERNMEYQISSRINLIPKENNKDRIRSENYTIEIRPLFKEFLLSKYPDLTIRLLEDPPGPPVRASFMIGVQGGENIEDLQKFTHKIHQKILQLSRKHDLVDIGTTLPTTYQKISLSLDHDAINRSGFTTEYISQSLGLIKNQTLIQTLQDPNNLESTSIVLTIDPAQTESLKLLDTLEFVNHMGVSVPLRSLVHIEHSFVSGDIQTDHKLPTYYVFAELGDDSVVYPTLSSLSVFKQADFLGDNLKVTSSSLYGIEFEDITSGVSYSIKWDGEWKLTMDTFQDLGIAMAFALLAIYFLIVAQFQSFRVAGIVMLPFLLGFFGVFPGFSLLYLLQNEYFNATGMIGVIALAGIVVGNSILLIDYIEIKRRAGTTIDEAVLQAGYVRFMPIMLTSIAAILGAAKIVNDPVWSGLAWSLIWGLGVSAILTLIVIPIFYYESQYRSWNTKKDA